MDKPKVIFVGSILSDYGLTKNRGISAAASQWSSGLLNSLIRNGCDVRNLSHVWNTTFPLGKILPGNKDDLSNEYDTILVKYFNIKGLRDYSLYVGLLKAFLGLTKQSFLPDFILFYNAYPYNIWLAKKIKDLFPDIKLVLLVLDYNDPEPDDWVKFKHDSEIFDGCVFLSWWAYENSPIDNKIHVDAGWNGFFNKSPSIIQSQDFVFVYAGKMEKYGGILHIIDAIKQLPKEQKNLRFEFYGKGSSSELLNLSKIDKRVIVNGFVSEKELEKAFNLANAFLSPLDMTVSDNRMVFPSKIMNYLRYQKPILASHSEGISREYDDVLFYPIKNNADSWLSLISNVSLFNRKDYELVATKSRKLLSIKTWDMHVERMIDFIKNI